jgi:LuxR family maltose regulon positive regulatory protein
LSLPALWKSMSESAPVKKPAPAARGQVLLTTKLYVPRSRMTLVTRPALFERLQEGLQGKLTLVSAPAGFGKTTLVASWVRQTGFPAAWLSLDSADNDLSRFLAYLAAALQTVDDSLGEEMMSAVEGNQPVQIPELLAGLLNEIEQMGRPLVLVLDDYHLITQEEVHTAVRFLIDNLPASMHLIISTREDPPWPLARLRVGGQLSEIRGRDLRFTLEETAEFCNKVMGLAMSPQDISALDSRAEGWVAGLQMAALSMHGQGDVSRLVAGFSGSNRYVLEYLLEEVLSHQPPPVQRFLLQTAVLDRLCAPLCDVILEGQEIVHLEDAGSAAAGSASQALLERLEAANLFITSLDENRYWYRYHNLFAGLLRARLGQTDPDQVSLIHRRAAKWLAARGLVEEAIGHALEAGDFDLAAGLLEREGIDLVSRHKMVSLARWLEALPQGAIDSRPWLCIFMAYTRHWLGDRQYALGACLDQAERALEITPPAEESERRRIRGYIASLRAQDALSAGNAVPRIIEQANLALELLPPGDLMGTEAGVSLGGAYWMQGDARASERAFAAGRDTSIRCGKYLMAVPTATYAGWQQMKQGRLQEAQGSFEQALSWATRETGKTVPVGGFPMLRISDLRYEWGDLAGAEEMARQARELCLRLSQADVVVDAHATLGLRLWANGRFQEAWFCIEQGDEAARDHSPDAFLLTRLDTCRVYLWLAEGGLDKARAWLAAGGPHADGPLSFFHDLHHLLAVRILLEDGRPREALALALRIAAAAERGNWVGEQMKALTLAAAAAQLLEETDQALAYLSRALQLGANGRFVRTILDQGPLVAGLLRRLDPAAGVPAAYLDHLRAASAVKPASRTEPTQALVEPLSDRELEILDLIALGLSNQQIATRLVLSLATVKWHASNIYGKLGVSNRSQAVVKARELGVIT